MTIEDCTCHGWVEFDPDCPIRDHQQIGMAALSPLAQLGRVWRGVRRPMVEAWRILQTPPTQGDHVLAGPGGTE